MIGTRSPLRRAPRRYTNHHLARQLRRNRPGPSGRCSTPHRGAQVRDEGDLATSTRSRPGSALPALGFGELDLEGRQSRHAQPRRGARRDVVLGVCPAPLAPNRAPAGTRRGYDLDVELARRSSLGTDLGRIGHAEGMSSPWMMVDFRVVKIPANREEIFTFMQYAVRTSRKAGRSRQRSWPACAEYCARSKDERANPMPHADERTKIFYQVRQVVGLACLWPLVTALAAPLRFPHTRQPTQAGPRGRGELLSSASVIPAGPTTRCAALVRAGIRSCITWSGGLASTRNSAVSPERWCYR